jgi:hypothetical protein
MSSRRESLLEEPIKFPNPCQRIDLIDLRGLLDGGGKICRNICPRLRRFGVDLLQRR